MIEKFLPLPVCVPEALLLPGARGVPASAQRTTKKGKTKKIQPWIFDDETRIVHKN